MRPDDDQKRPTVAIDGQTVREIIGVIGAGLAGYGAWLHYRPAGFIVAGGILVVIAAIGTLKAGK